MKIATACPTAGRSTSPTVETETLTLQAGGEIRNAGTLRAADFIDQGGAMGPNPVQETGGAQPLILSIDAMLPDRAPARFVPNPSPRIRLTWRAPMDRACQLESSADLRHWLPLGTPIVPRPDGLFVADIPLEAGCQFLRVR